MTHLNNQEKQKLYELLRRKTPIGGTVLFKGEHGDVAVEMHYDNLQDLQDPKKEWQMLHRARMAILDSGPDAAGYKSLREINKRLNQLEQTGLKIPGYLLTGHA